MIIIHIILTTTVIQLNVFCFRSTKLLIVMRVYCKCLNVEVTAYTSENKARPWKTIAVEAEDDGMPLFF